MTAKLGGVADRLLTRMLHERTAYAGCAPDCDYRCFSHHLYRCCYDLACNYNCVSTGNYC
jgi:hypothetical protein